MVQGSPATAWPDERKCCPNPKTRPAGVINHGARNARRRPCSLRPRTTPTGQAWPAWSTTCLPTTYATASRRPSTRLSYKGNALPHDLPRAHQRTDVVGIEGRSVITRIEGLFDKQAAHQPPSTGRGVRLPSAPLGSRRPDRRCLRKLIRSPSVSSAQPPPAAGQGSAPHRPQRFSTPRPAVVRSRCPADTARHCWR